MPAIDTTMPERWPRYSRRRARAAATFPFFARLLGVVALAVLPNVAGTARAEAPPDPAYLAIGIGHFDFLDDKDAFDVRLEYRHDRGPWRLKPWGGVEVTSDGSVYGVAGLLIDLSVGRNFVITPSLGAGAYGDGHGKDLGHTVEFRSQLEIGRRLANDARVSLAFSHISNANLDDKNSGTEVLTVYYAISLDGLFDN